MLENVISSLFNNVRETSDRFSDVTSHFTKDFTEVLKDQSTKLLNFIHNPPVYYGLNQEECLPLDKEMTFNNGLLGNWSVLEGLYDSSELENGVLTIPDIIENFESSDIDDKFIKVISCDDDTAPQFLRKNDREEIRRRLAMGTDDDYVSPRRRSLQARLQSNMNLQICFMNDTASDTEEDIHTENGRKSMLETRPRSSSLLVQAKPVEKIPTKVSTIIKSSSHCTNQRQQDKEENRDYDFFSCQARLQAEARLALAQAHQMARMQMEVERQKKKKSPIAEMIGVPQLGAHRRLTRQLLTKMNVAQLQLIVNDFHSQIECLNEELVRLLLGRDDLHMEQDSMLVDIEDLTRYLGAKESNLRQKVPELNTKKEVTQNKLPRGIRIQSLIKK